MDFSINIASDLWHHSDFEILSRRTNAASMSQDNSMRSLPNIRPVNSYLAPHFFCLQALMRRDIPAAEHICAIHSALTPVRMQLPTCSGTASIPPRTSTRCSLTTLLRFVVLYCEHLPNLDASSSSALANWSLSFSGIHKVKTFY